MFNDPDFTFLVALTVGLIALVNIVALVSKRRVETIRYIFPENYSTSKEWTTVLYYPHGSTIVDDGRHVTNEELAEKIMMRLSDHQAVVLPRDWELRVYPRTTKTKSKETNA